MSKRSIQFRRNNQIVNSYKDAINLIEGHKNEYLDGEQIMARYQSYKKSTFVLDDNNNKIKYATYGLTDVYLGVPKVGCDQVTIDTNNYCVIDENREIYATGSTHTKYEDEVKTVVGYVYSTGDTKYITYVDVENTVEYAVTHLEDYGVVLPTSTHIDNNFDSVVKAVGLSGDSRTNSIGYSADTTSEILASTNSVASALTALANAVEEISGKTIEISQKEDNAITNEEGTEEHPEYKGLYVPKVTVEYSASTNTIKIGDNEPVKLTGINFIKDAVYSAETEEIIITYSATTESGVEEKILEIPVSGIIEEFDFVSATTENNNVALVSTRSTAGKTVVKANIDTFDCGCYDEEETTNEDETTI